MVDTPQEQSRSQKKKDYAEIKKLASSQDVDVRCDVAAKEDAPQEILFFLANDTEDKVRLNVANNFHTPWEADQVLSKDKNPDIRSAVTDKIIEKLDKNEGYANKKSPFNKFFKKIVNIFDGLVDDSVSYIRQKVSRAVIAKGYFPKELVEKLLTHNDREIAMYAVKHVGDLDDADLLKLLKGDHSNISEAIASRQGLSGDVVEELVKKGDKETLYKVLQNPSAKIAEGTMGDIIEKSAGDEALQEEIVKRPDLNLGFIKRIAIIVSGSMLKELMLRNHLSKAEAEEVSAQVRERLDGEEMLGVVQDVLNNEFYQPFDDPPEERAYQAFLKGQLTEEYLMKALECYQEEYVVAALSLRANIAREIVQKAVAYKNAKAIIAIVWRAGFSMRFATEVQTKLLKMVSGIIYPRNGKNFPFTPKEMSWQIDFFMGLGEGGEG